MAAFRRTRSSDGWTEGFSLWTVMYSIRRRSVVAFSDSVSKCRDLLTYWHWYRRSSKPPQCLSLLVSAVEMRSSTSTMEKPTWSTTAFIDSTEKKTPTVDVVLMSLAMGCSWWPYEMNHHCPRRYRCRLWWDHCFNLVTETILERLASKLHLRSPFSTSNDTSAPHAYKCSYYTRTDYTF